MKSYYATLFLIFVIFGLFSESIKKSKIAKIKYLSNEVLDEKIMRSYLGFKEGYAFNEDELNIVLEMAKLRLNSLGFLKNIEISYLYTEDNQKQYDINQYIVTIKLENGYKRYMNSAAYWFEFGWKNFLNRDDYIGFAFGINRNIFNSKHHFPAGFVYFKQEFGWEWLINSAHFPFFPLYGNEYSYKHNLFYKGQFGFRVHPDINIGLYFGERTLFLQTFMNLQMFLNNNNSIDQSKYSFYHSRSGVTLGAFFSYDNRYLIEKYKVGTRIDVEGGANIDIMGLSTYPELSTKIRFGVMPHSYIFLLTNIKLLNQFGNSYTDTKFSIKDYQRGNLTLGTLNGNFLFNWSFDFRVKLASWRIIGLTQTLGLSNFYEGFIITDDYNLPSQITPIEYKNIVGGGIWLKMGVPFNFSIFAEFGYTIGEDFLNGYKINVGLREFF